MVTLKSLTVEIEPLTVAFESLTVEIKSLTVAIKSLTVAFELLTVLNAHRLCVCVPLGHCTIFFTPVKSLVDSTFEQSKNITSAHV